MSATRCRAPARTTSSRSRSRSRGRRKRARPRPSPSSRNSPSAPTTRSGRRVGRRSPTTRSTGPRPSSATPSAAQGHRHAFAAIPGMRWSPPDPPPRAGKRAGWRGWSPSGVGVGQLFSAVETFENRISHGGSMSTAAMPTEKPRAEDFLAIDRNLSDEERDIRDTVRAYVRDKVVPNVGDWFEEGSVPARELAKELGSLNVLGMHLEGYGCAGASGTAYGLACLELEAGDSGVRSMVSVQGSLAMFAIWKFGSEEQKQKWLAGMAGGELLGWSGLRNRGGRAAGQLLGCFGLTEPDAGSDPASMTTRARRDGSDWILNGRKMWITNGSVADVAIVWAVTDDGICGFIVPTDTPGFSANTIHHKLSLRASITSELVLDDVRLPDDALLPEVKGLKGPLSCLSEARYGIIWGSMG